MKRSGSNLRHVRRGRMQSLSEMVSPVALNMNENIFQDNFRHVSHHSYGGVTVIQLRLSSVYEFYHIFVRLSPLIQALQAEFVTDRPEIRVIYIKVKEVFKVSLIVVAAAKRETRFNNSYNITHRTSPPPPPPPISMDLSAVPAQLDKIKQIYRLLGCRRDDTMVTPSTCCYRAPFGDVCSPFSINRSLYLPVRH